MEFDDTPADILRAIMAAMQVSKTNCQSPSVIKAFKKLLPADLFGLLALSVRLLMPWAGVSYARAAVEDSKDAKTLVKLVSKDQAFYGTDEEQRWLQVRNTSKYVDPRTEYTL